MISGPRRLGSAVVADAGAAGGVCGIARQLVACGGFHMMAVTAAGHARTCGDNSEQRPWPAGREVEFLPVLLYWGGNI
jgi:hypothetical protein